MQHPRSRCWPIFSRCRLYLIVQVGPSRPVWDSEVEVDRANAEIAPPLDVTTSRASSPSGAGDVSTGACDSCRPQATFPLVDLPTGPPDLRRNAGDVGHRCGLQIDSNAHDHNGSVPQWAPRPGRICVRGAAPSCTRRWRTPTHARCLPLETEERHTDALGGVKPVGGQRGTESEAKPAKGVHQGRRPFSRLPHEEFQLIQGPIPHHGRPSSNSWATGLRRILRARSRISCATPTALGLQVASIPARYRNMLRVL